MKKHSRNYIVLLVLVIFCGGALSAQNDCSNTLVVCGNSGYQDLNVTGFGVQELSGSNTCGSQENNSIWLDVTVKGSGTLAFTLTPTTTDLGEDFDFFIFGPNVTCGNIGQAIRCSTTNPLGAGLTHNLTGLSTTETDTSEGPGPDGNSFVSAINATAGERYFIVIDRPIGTSNFDLTWTGTATFNDGPDIDIPATTTVNLEACDTVAPFNDGIAEFDLTVNDAPYINGQANVGITYHLNTSDAQTGDNPITNPSNYLSTSNRQTIFVRLENSVTGCFATSAFQIEVNNNVTPGTPNDLIICDTDGDGLEVFDLSQNNALLSAGITNPIISYHLTENDANNNLNSISTSYTNQTAFTAETIWARLEIQSTGCSGVTSFTITTFEDAVATQPTDINFCDSDGDGFNTFDLIAEKGAEILNGLSNTTFNILFFTNEADAIANTNSIPRSYTNSAAFSTDTIWVRVHNVNESSLCFDTTSFQIQVTSEPTPTAPSDYIVCDMPISGSSDTDGFYENFDLTTKNSEILTGLTPGLYTVSYHLSQVDADSGANPINTAVPFNSANAINKTIYVRVENVNNANCKDSSLSFRLEAIPQPKTDPATNILACSSTGFETFDLAALKDTEVLGTQSNTVFNVIYYTTQADALANTNPILGNVFTTTNYGIYTIWSRVFHTTHPTTCTDANQAITSFQIFVTQDPTGLVQSAPVPYRFCDNNSVGTDIDGVINSFILSSKDAEVLNSLSASQFNITYHVTAADANSDINPIDKANPYTNTTPNQQTVYARIENVDNPLNCVTIVNFDLVVDPLPAITSTASLKQCDADANPNDGFSFFNLTEANSLFSTNHVNETFEYYGSQTGAQNATASELINTPTSFQNRTVSTDTVWARIINNNGCFRVGQLNLISSTSAIPNVITHRFNVCDDFDGTPGSDTDGTTVFDFSSVDAQIRALFPQAVEVSYYQNEADSAIENAPITNTSSFRNTLANTVGGRQIIWVRVESTLNEDCLGRSGYIELIIDPIPVANPVTDLELCDDFQDGNGTNGFVQSFDLESQTATILGTQNPANYAVTYHISNADASTGANPLSSPFTNTIAGGQEIFVRVTNTNNPATTNQCVTYHTSFNVVVNPLPIANAVPDLEVCDDAADGSPTNGFAQGINLEVQTPGILGTQDPNQFTVTYHGTLAEAQAGIVPLVSNNFSNSVQNRQTIWVRVYNSVTQCANGISNFDVIVNPEPVFTAVSTLEYCDNDDNGEDDTDGIIVGDIDLTQQTERLIDPAGTGQVLADFTVTYYTSQADATAGMNAIADPSNFTNTVPRRQTIYVRIQNNITGCANDEAFFDVVVNPLPDFQVTTPQIVCLNGPNLTIRVENPADTYDYVWTDPNGNNIVGSFLTISSGGLYSITATMTDGTNCSRTRTIQVNESIIATITQDDVTIVDDSDNNSITIDPTNLGIGDYEYALTDQNNVFVRSYQDSPLFERLEGGFYNILVRDKNGCGEVSLLVSVVEFPKFFTPNNDGINDTWIVKGANSTFFPTSSIYIFNRYGKVVANIPIDSQGWNGSYGGNNLPSDDYWFAIKLVDQQGTIRERKGNFSLLRK